MGPFDFVEDVFGGGGSGIPGGDLISSAIDYTFQSKQASRSRAFSREMDSTKYQRAMKDMRMAGLNPILAAGGISTGSGASAPGSPSGGSLQQNRTSSAQKQQASAAEKQANTARKLMHAQIKNVNQDTKLKNDQAHLAYQTSAREMYQGAKLISEKELVDLETMLRKFDVPGRKFEAEMDADARGEISRLMKRYPVIGNVLQSLGYGAAGAAIWKHQDKKANKPKVTTRQKNRRKSKITRGR